MKYWIDTLGEGCMLGLNRRPQITLLFLVVFGFSAAPAQAGPLIDWLFGRTPPAYPVGQPVPVGTQAAVANPAYAAGYGAYYGPQMPVIGPSGAAYRPPVPAGITATTLPPTTSYVPDFRTYASRTPVTYYRPVLTTDPVSGAQVVRMAPCTSYEYQAQRYPTGTRRSLYGSSLLPAVVPAPAAVPTYTLPRGGVAIASTTPSVPQPYVTAYPGYGVTALPGAVQGSVRGTYPTTVLSPTYGGVAPGGCNGSYTSPGYAAPGYTAPSYTTPGLVAPQAPASVPGYTSPAPGISPSTSVPPATGPAPVYPPAGSASSDPAANVPPSLPPTGDGFSSNNRRPAPQVRSMVRVPDEVAGSPVRDSSVGSGKESSKPVMSPIPVPDDFPAQPGYRPGLLSDEDLTALRPTYRNANSYNGQSKKIHWASFEEVVRTDSPTEIRQPSHSGLRSISRERQSVLPSQEPRQSAKPKTYHRDSSGWKTAR